MGMESRQEAWEALEGKTERWGKRNHQEGYCAMKLMYALVPHPGQPDCSQCLASWRKPSQQHPLHRMPYKKGNRAPENMLDCSWADMWLSGGIHLCHQSQKAQEVPLLQVREGKGLQTTRTNPPHHRNFQAGGTRLC